MAFASAALAAELSVRQTWRMPRQRLTPIGLCLLMAFMVVGACRFDPYPSNYAKVKPIPDEVVGRWVATADTAKQLAARGLSHLRPRIMLEPGGLVTILDVPDEWSSAEGQPPRVPEYRGRWKLAADSHGKWGILLEPAAPFCYQCLMVVRDSAPRLLVMRYGDPDSGTGYEFERAVEQ
jgi:hypothetical protein